MSCHSILSLIDPYIVRPGILAVNCQALVDVAHEHHRTFPFSSSLAPYLPFTFVFFVYHSRKLWTVPLVVIFAAVLCFFQQNQ
jgi:hypothetical protein